jgi:OmcA/MtrC family decaheme c-type cytochrome
LKGLTISVANVANFEPGKKPTVAFAIKNGDGTAVDGSKLTTFAPMIAGGTGSYSKYIRESAVGKAAFDATTGQSVYTFTAAIPADATGTWTITSDTYRNINLKRADGKADIAVREAATNPIKYMSLSASATATPRRTSVAMTQCNSCHDRLALHGDQRLVIEECVICHNPTEGDQARRPADAGAKESVSFQRMIHRIHTGEELTQEYTVYGFGSSKNNFNEVRYPGDRRNCAKCHVNTASYTLPVATSAEPVTTMRDYFSPQGPGTAACLGCHDNKDAAAHAYLNTTTFGGTQPAEACATCHGTGKEWAAEKVHAR